MVHVFGYGSLMCPDSANVTLQRPQSPDTPHAATLAGYRRVWNVVSRRRFLDDDEPTSVIVLGIEPAADVNMVGTVIALRDDDELARLDEREALYDRIDVTALISPRFDGTVYTYLPRPEHTRVPDDAVIARNYLDIVMRGCGLQGDAFTRRYHETTAPHNVPIRDGETERVTPAPATSNPATPRR